MHTLDEQPDRWFDKIWWRTREQLRAEMDPVRFQYWIAPLRVASADPEHVVIVCRTPFSRDQVALKFGKQIADLIAVSLPRLRGVDFIVDPTLRPPGGPTRPRVLPGTGPEGDGGGAPASPHSAAAGDAAPAATARPADDSGEAKKGGPRILIEDVKRRVAEYFAIPISDLESASRKRAVVRARQAAMFVARDLTGRSYPEIARRFGSRDHTTVIHGCDKIRRLSETDPEVAAAIEALKRSILD